MNRHDILVVGSGPGGAITAALLAEAGMDVGVLERGGAFHLSSSPPFSLDEMLQKYKNSGLTTAFGMPKISYVEGCCLGGGSEINAGLYHRTPREILNNWVNEFDLKGVDEKYLEHIFLANEMDVAVSYMPPSLIPRASMKLHEGATALGWHSLEVPRWFKYAENATGVKQSMTETFIPRAINATAQFYVNRTVTKIYKNGDSWIVKGYIEQRAPLTLPKKEPFKMQAKYLFICGGAIGSAFVLKQNGLSKLAGGTLFMHPSIKMVARFNEKVNSVGMGVPVHQIKEFSPRLSIGCSISTPTYLSLAMLNVKGGELLVKNHWEEMGVYYAMSRQGSGGVTSVLGFNDPLVKFNVGEAGYQDALDGMIKLGECLFASGAVELYPVVLGSKSIRSMQELRRFVSDLERNRLQLMTIHLMGSCPMGENKSICVTDSFGQVHGQKKLYVNDASLMCSALGVNPQGSVMMLARRNVEKFLQEVK